MLQLSLGFDRMEPSGLQDLDDGCLLVIFKCLHPLPDLFNIGRTCKRFLSLTGDRRLWLVVAPLAIQVTDVECKKVFPTLEAAVASSRPGDTIWMAPGMAHVVKHVIVAWPLHVVGGGSRAEETCLLCPPGSDTALDFRATGKVANLSMRASRGSCILHRQGQLQVERCHLECSAHGMDHLWSPLITLASLQQQIKGLDAAGASSAGVGTGRLSVRETSIKGEGKAVHCCGTGSLQSVRAIYSARETMFWFDVDSSMPGRPQQGQHYWHSMVALAAPLPGAPTTPPLTEKLRSMSDAAIRALIVVMRPRQAQVPDTGGPLTVQPQGEEAHPLPAMVQQLSAPDIVQQLNAQEAEVQQHAMVQQLSEQGLEGMFSAVSAGADGPEEALWGPGGRGMAGSGSGLGAELCNDVQSGASAGVVMGERFKRLKRE